MWYKGQPLECDICQKGHKASDCDLRGKCKLCGSTDHFAHSCRNAWGRPAPRYGPDFAPAAAPGPDPAPASSPASVSAPAPVPPSVPTPASVPAPVPSMEVDASAVCEVEDSALKSILQGVSSVCNNANIVLVRDNNGHVSNLVSDNDCSSVSKVSNVSDNVERNNNVSEVTSVTKECNTERNNVSNDVSEVTCVTKGNYNVSEATNVADGIGNACLVTDVTNEIVIDSIGSSIEILPAFQELIEGIIEEGSGTCVPDPVIGEIFPFEDGQVINTPLGKHAVDSSPELDSLDSGDWAPLPKRPSRPKKKDNIVEDPDRSRSPVAQVAKDEPVVSSRDVKS